MDFILCTLMCGILTMSLGRPQQQQQQPQDVNTPIPIISHAESVGDNGNFTYSFDTGNGIHYEQSGYTKQTPVALQARNGDPNNQAAAYEETQVISGSYSYTAPDGTVIQLSYVADENGYQPIGEHLPTPPPIPAAIQRVLALLPHEEESADNRTITQ